MKNDKLRISKMVEELINYFFSIGCISISSDIKDMNEYYKIVFKAQKEGFSDCEIKKLRKLLSVGKSEEMEEYYWALTGECDVDTELSIVGMMCDEVSVECMDNDNIHITIRRNKI